MTSRKLNAVASGEKKRRRMRTSFIGVMIAQSTRLSVGVLVRGCG